MKLNKKDDKFDSLLMIVTVIANNGNQINSSTLIDIKDEREDREIYLLNNDNFKLYYSKNKLFLETTSSNRKIDDDFINKVTFLNMLRNQFNENYFNTEGDPEHEE